MKETINFDVIKWLIFIIIVLLTLLGFGLGWSSDYLYRKQPGHAWELYREAVDEETQRHNDSLGITNSR